MAGKYRAHVTIVGKTIRGWLANTADPREPVSFNLRIDGMLRGVFTAHRPKTVVMRGMPDLELAFSFEIPLAREWITGGIQEIRFEDPADDELDFVIRTALGPSPREFYGLDQVGGEMLFGPGGPVSRRESWRSAELPRAKLAQAEGRWLDACRLLSEHFHENPNDDTALRRLEDCARRAAESADTVEAVKDVLDAWHLLASCQPDSLAARRGIAWSHMTLASEAEREDDVVAARAHWNTLLEVEPDSVVVRDALQRLDGEAPGISSQAQKYRGQLKIAGNTIRGWLLDTTQPFEPVPFNLRVDGRLRGMFLAAKQKAIFMRRMPDVSLAFEFEAQMPPEWISGSVQEIKLESPADPSLKMVLRAALGPAPCEHFGPDRIAGDTTIGSDSSAGSQRVFGTEDFGRIVRACAASLREGNFDAARHALKSAVRSDSDAAKRDLANAFGLLAREEVSPEVRHNLILEQIEMLRYLTGSADRMAQINAYIGLSTALSSIGRYPEAAEAADLALLRVPNSVRALVAKAKALVPQNAIKEACALYEKVVDIEPHNQSIRTTLRVLTTLSADESQEDETASIAVIGSDDRLERVVGSDHASNGSSSPNWICVSDSTALDTAQADLAALLASGCRAGFLQAEGSATGDQFWRLEAIQGLVESGLLRPENSARELAPFAQYYSASREPRTGAAANRGAVVVTSRNGGFKFGGGEHFIESVSEHYAEEGYAPIIVGTRPELRGEERVVNGVRHVFIEDSVAAFRRFVLENDVTLVHAISGMGFVVAEALKFTNIPFVYGVHFWREMLGSDQSSTYFNADRPVARKEFKVILARAAVVYANSQYTQKIIEESFGARCPIIYSVPREIGASLT
jgi:tetratricopeptide (TPR) repeat protein